MVVATTDVYGVFYDKALADRSFQRLLDAHFEEADVGLKDPGILGTKDLSHDRESSADGSTAVVIASIAIGGVLGLGAGLGGAVGGGFDAVTRAEDLLRQAGAQAIFHTGSFESPANIQTSRE